MLSFTTFTTLLLMANVALCHMVMNLPTPFSQEKATTFPLDAPGGRYPFPCTGMTGFSSRTSLVPGTTTTVNFTGAAPHGGGSCQFGINYHAGPNGSPYSVDNPGDWKTIYTIIGGCPAVTAGNLEHAPFYRGLDPDGRPDAVHCGNDSGVDCIRQFEVPIPKGLPKGEATFAWVWFNKITAGEIYMTCAPVLISGDEDGDEAFVEELPSMFFANIEGFTNCSTSKTGDQGVFNIPNPGRFGVQLVEPDPKAAGNCPVAPPAVFETQVPGSTAPATTVRSDVASTTLTSAKFGSTTTVTVTAGITTVTAGITTDTPVGITRTVTVTVTAGISTATTLPSGFVTSTRSLASSVTTAAGKVPVPTSTSILPTPSKPGLTPTNPVAPRPRCPQPGHLVCLGESAFAICDPYGVVGESQRLNPEQICIDGKVVLRGT